MQCSTILGSAAPRYDDVTTKTLKTYANHLHSHHYQHANTHASFTSWCHSCQPTTCTQRDRLLLHACKTAYIMSHGRNEPYHSICTVMPVHLILSNVLWLRLPSTYIQPSVESSPCISCGPWRPQKSGGNSWNGCRSLGSVQAATPSHAPNVPLCLPGYRCSQFAAHITSGRSLTQTSNRLIWFCYRKWTEGMERNELKQGNCQAIGIKLCQQLDSQGIEKFLNLRYDRTFVKTVNISVFSRLSNEMQNTCVLWKYIIMLVIY